MSVILLALIVLITPAGAIFAEQTTQTDWSAGTDSASPTVSLGDTFGSSSDISWLAVPGQIALASVPIEDPIKHLIADGHDGAYGLYAVDFDGDGDIDVIGATDRSHEVIIWFNSGSNPVSWNEHVVDASYQGGTSIHPADIDGDGDMDLVAAAQTPGDNVTWWRNEGGDPLSWSRFRIEQSLPVACNVFVADMDGDGDLDVASTSWTENYIAWWRNDGESEDWARVMIEDQFPAAHSAFAFDADGDGDNDVVGTSANTGQVVLFLNDLGDGTTWTWQVIGTGMAGVRYATAADIDHDGRIDIAASAFNGQVMWWHNEGGSPPSWTQHTVDQSCLGAHYLSVGDFNGDGNNDLLVAPTALHSLFWYVQDPADPDNWDRVEIDRPFNTPLTGFPADIDGDGDLDVVGTSPVLGEIAWWEITRFSALGTLQSSTLDLGEHQGLHGIGWQASVPFGTALTISVRTSNNLEDLGPWSPEIGKPAVIFSPWGRYLQFRVTMTSDGAASPILHDITAFWNGPEVNTPGILVPRFGAN